MSGIVTSDTHAENRQREDICFWAGSLFARGLTGGASGNISARLPDGAVSPVRQLMVVVFPAPL